MPRPVTVPIVLLLAGLAAVAPAIAGGDRVEQKRSAIDEMAVSTLERLFHQNPETGELYDASVAYAVFDNVKVAVLLSGGGGVGVAVDRESRVRTYMKMGTAGIGLGLGGQSYQVVFFFETEEAYRRFVDKGWQADAAANAAAGSRGFNRDNPFTEGVAVFQLTNKGLLAQADISGTKYWRARKLNRGR